MRDAEPDQANSKERLHLAQCCDGTVHSRQHCILRSRKVLPPPPKSPFALRAANTHTVPKEDLAAAKQIAASLFLQNVFGTGRAVKGLNFLIALSSFGNLLAVLLGQSRVIRECGRQGVLPWPRFWASTKPLGTPLGPYFVKWILTIIMILAPPAGDAFNFSRSHLVHVPNAY